MFVISSKFLDIKVVCKKFYTFHLVMLYCFLADKEKEIMKKKNKR